LKKLKPETIALRAEQSKFAIEMAHEIDRHLVEIAALKAELAMETDYAGEMREKVETLKARVAELEAANAQCISLGLHESRTQELTARCSRLEKALEYAKKWIGDKWGGHLTDGTPINDIDRTLSGGGDVG
jgi:hypothetical protein